MVESVETKTPGAVSEFHVDKVIKLEKERHIPQQYVNRVLPDVQAGFRKGRGTWDQIANIHQITEKA